MRRVRRYQTPKISQDSNDSATPSGPVINSAASGLPASSSSTGGSWPAATMTSAQNGPRLAMNSPMEHCVAKLSVSANIIAYAGEAGPLSGWRHQLEGDDVGQRPEKSRERGDSEHAREQFRLAPRQQQYGSRHRHLTEEQATRQQRDDQHQPDAQEHDGQRGAGYREREHAGERAEADPHADQQEGALQRQHPEGHAQQLPNVLMRSSP